MSERITVAKDKKIKQQQKKLNGDNGNGRAN